MSANNSRFPRGLLVLLTMAVMAVLIWLFATKTSLYYNIGAFVLITAMVTFLIYRKPSPGKPKIKKVDKPLLVENEVEIAPFEMKSETLKPGDIFVPYESTKAANRSTPNPIEVLSTEESPVPLIDDQSSLAMDEENILVNAVWSRCENPYCKYTSFLRVHHILDEKVGGSNKLDNLIVLCPYCHDLAHRNEVPEKEMKTWISDRAERWKFKPQWKYF